MHRSLSDVRGRGCSLVKVQALLPVYCCLVDVYVVVQFYPWFKFSFLLFLGIVMYDNEFETKEIQVSQYAITLYLTTYHRHINLSQ